MNNKTHLKLFGVYFNISELKVYQTVYILLIDDSEKLFI